MTVAAKLELARGVSRVTGSWLAERLRPRPTNGDRPPASTAKLTTDWLSRVLCDGRPGAEVVDFEVGAGSDGTCARQPLRVTYNAAGVQAGLPSFLYTKSSPTLMTRLFVGLTNAMLNEGEFYLQVRPLLDIETPVAYYAGHDDRSGTSLLILEDIAATRGARFSDPTETRVSRSDAEEMVELMAGYHAPFWASTKLDDEYTWLMSAYEWQRRMNDVLGFGRMFRNGLRRAWEVLPPELVARVDELWPSFLRSFELEDGRPITLIHQDTHSVNWYWTDRGRMGIYDWQANAKGSWAIDVPYALACGLDVEERRKWERDLLGLYLERLASGGAAAPDDDSAWLSYRQQMVHGLAYWFAAYGHTSLQPEINSPEVCETNIRRLSQAVVDLETLDAISA